VPDCVREPACSSSSAASLPREKLLSVPFAQSFFSAEPFRNKFLMNGSHRISQFFCSRHPIHMMQYLVRELLV
jgi:hypothetical protein